MPTKQQAMHRDRSLQQHRGGDRAAHRRQIDHPHGGAQRVEAGLERQRQQRTGEQLDAGLNDPQFLQQAEPIAV